MSRYAANTTVSSEKSRGEIERVLTRYGATAFSYGWRDEGDETMAMVGFRAVSRTIRFLIPMPCREAFRYTPSQGRKRRDDQIDAEHEKACRQRWRALLLVVKAKLEAVEAEISTFDEEFLPHIVLPNGRTVAEMALPEIDRAYSTGDTPPLLLPPAENDVIDVEVVE